MTNSKNKKETFGDFKREIRVIISDFQEAGGLFKEEFLNLFNFKGDHILKVYIIFVLILLPILLTKVLGPFFIEAVE